MPHTIINMTNKAKFMEKNKEFLDKYQFVKEKQAQIETKGYLTEMEKIYTHEVRGKLMNSIGGFLELYENEKVEEIGDQEMQEMIDKNKSRLERALAFTPILDIQDFSKKGLQTQTPTNLNEILQSEKDFYQTEYGANITLNETQTPLLYLNPAALKTFISTNIGDAVKWTPKGETINITSSQENERIKISIENKFGSTPIKTDIGMGEKIGSKYTKLFLDTIGGEMTNKINVSNSQDQDKTFYKEFILPKN